jgi:hypothetical protein
MDLFFSGADVASLLQIAGEVGELERDVKIRRSHILNRLVELVGACSGVCSDMDPRYVHDYGWALPNSIICSDGVSAEQQELINRYLKGNLAALDPCIPPLLGHGQPTMTVRRADVVADRSWFQSDHFNLIRRPLGMGESLYATIATPDGRRLKLSLHRGTTDSPFTDRHVGLVQMFNENLASLYVVTPRREPVAADPALIADPRINVLPQRLRPVLRRLLAGDSEKQAALRLDLSPHTIHEYTKLLYRTFGVNSRGELLACFMPDLVI